MIVKIGNKKYFLDKKLNQLRNINNPHDFLEFEYDFWLIVGLKKN